MRVFLCLAFLCALAIVAPANAATAVSFSPILPSANPAGVLYYKETLTVVSVWDAQPTLAQAQIRIVDPNGKQTIVPATSCVGSPPTCTTNYVMTAFGGTPITTDLSFSYLATLSSNLVPRTWCFLVKGVCADPALAPAPTSFDLVYSVSLLRVTMFSNNALPGVAVAGNTVSVKYTFNTPMSSGTTMNCSINGMVATKTVSRYDVTCSRVVGNSDLNGSPSKLLPFYGSSSQFTSAGNVGCTQGLCAGTSLITSTSDLSSVTLYAAMQGTTSSISSNNVDASRAEVGDTITLTFNFNQLVSTTVLPDCKINGFQATVSAVSNAYICSRVVTPADLNGQQTATATFSLTTTGIQNAAGLPCSAGFCTSSIVNFVSPVGSSRVVMYALNPLSLTTVSIASDNVDSTKARVGDTITLVLGFNQAVTSISSNACTLLAHSVPAVIIGSTVTCSYTVSSSDPSGPASFTVTSSAFFANSVTCTAGLCTSATVSATTDASAVVVSVCDGGANVGNYVLTSVSAGKQACVNQCN